MSDIPGPGPGPGPEDFTATEATGPDETTSFLTEEETQAIEQIYTQIEQTLTEAK